jgi:O-methyltransferase
MTLPTRYLQLLRKSLLNEIYLENDARMLHILESFASGRPPDGEALRNIRAREPDRVARLESDRAEGRPWWFMKVRQPDGTRKVMSARDYCDFTHSMIGGARMRNIEECLDVVRAGEVPGDLVETGVWRGGATVFMRGYLAAYGMEGRDVWVADSFEGLPRPTLAEDLGFDFSAARAPILAVPLEEVRALFARYDLLDDRVRFLKGWFRDTLPGAPIERLALLRLDGDLYESTMDALEALYDKVSPGGFVLVDDYGDFPPCRKAIDEFRSRRGIDAPLVTVDWSGAYWRKP